jgi:uncharacterized protein (DUF433 family)
MGVTVLEREMFSEAETARLLRVSQSTLHYWLEGGKRRGKYYQPVLRAEPLGRRTVTWGEFVEASLLRRYRKEHSVPMLELRTVIEMLREQYGTPYPLATVHPFVGPGPQLLLETQERAGLSGEFCLVALASGQAVLTAASASFVSRVQWDDDLAVAWRPHAEPASPVRMQPDVRFGLPAVGGVRTEVVWEHLETDESFTEVAKEFDLSVDEVHWAHAYETAVRAEAASPAA